MRLSRIVWRSPPNDGAEAALCLPGICGTRSIPSYAENSAACFAEFIDDVGGFLRNLEMRLHGRAHPQTVSVFSPHMVLDSRIAETIFRHPALDFANIHFYEEGTIDHPATPLIPPFRPQRLTHEALREIDPDAAVLR